MPLVFVHGVANRVDDDNHAERSAQRDELFRRFLLPVIGGTATERIHGPYWGDLAGKFRCDGASFPGAGREHGEHLGSSADLDLAYEAVASEGADDPQRVLLGIARRDVSDAVDLLYSVAPRTNDQQARVAADTAARLAAYLSVREREVESRRYPWLAEVDDDGEFLDRLLDEALPDRTAYLGDQGWIQEWLVRARKRLQRAAASVAGAPTTAAVDLLRWKLPSVTARTLGDILAYLSSRGTADAPGPIIELVAEEIEQAAAVRTPDRPLVVVAHSLGGVITFDLLTHFRPGLVVDCLVTVGSQVGLFEELGLMRYDESDPPLDAGWTRTVPSTIRHWINVVDRADPLAFRADPIFDRVADYRYPTGAPWAHGAYLRQPRFHERLAGRIASRPE